MTRSESLGCAFRKNRRPRRFLPALSLLCVHWDSTWQRGPCKDLVRGRLEKTSTGRATHSVLSKRELLLLSLSLLPLSHDDYNKDCR